MNKLTHIDEDGAAHMVDVGDKPATQREAVASGKIFMQQATLQLVTRGEHKKGDVLGVARIAGIMAAKQTAHLIPLCHQISLSKVSVEFVVNSGENSISCHVTAKSKGSTGVEMEALTAVQIALLTIYDMCKAVDRGMKMMDIQLLEKRGGKSGDWRKP